MSVSPAPANHDVIEEPKKITFRFCREWYVLYYLMIMMSQPCANITPASSNLLYPREDKTNSTLTFFCRTCFQAEPAATSCVYRNEISRNVGETAGITQDVGSDPTVGDHVSYPDGFSNEDEVDGDYEYGGDAYYGDAATVEGEDEEANPDEMPGLCTYCGEEIRCLSCGKKDSDVGIMLEVDGNSPQQNDRRLSISFPTHVKEK